MMKPFQCPPNSHFKHKWRITLRGKASYLFLFVASDGELRNWRSVKILIGSSRCVFMKQASGETLDLKNKMNQTRKASNWAEAADV